MVVVAGVERGRPRVVSPRDIAGCGLRLFLRDGYAATSMDQVAAAAAVSRSTVFRYFPTKPAIVWAGTERSREVLIAHLDGADPHRAWRLAVLEAVLASQQHQPEDHPILRDQLRLINTVAVLRAHVSSTTADWHAPLAAFIARHTGAEPEDLMPTALAAAIPAATFAGLSWWACHSDGDPAAAVATSLTHIGLP